MTSHTEFKFEVGQAVQFALHDDEQFRYGKTGIIVQNEALNPNNSEMQRELAKGFPYRVVWDDGQSNNLAPLIQLVAGDDNDGYAGVGWLMREDELEAI